jgi:hypothetical protein
MPVSDTSPEIEAMQAKIHAAMTGEQRLLMALEMSRFSHALARRGIRDRHPDWSEEEVIREFRRSLFKAGKVPPGL